MNSADRTLNIHTVGAWLEVLTAHEYRLEFVLRDQEDKTHEEVNPFSYSDCVDRLWDLLHAAVEDHPNLKVDETEEYGGLMFHLVANTYEELQEGMEICAPVVQAWIDEFKVNDMGGKR